MIYEFVTRFIMINIIFELIEIVFPSNRMSLFVKSFAGIILLASVIDIFI